MQSKSLGAMSVQNGYQCMSTSSHLSSGFLSYSSLLFCSFLFFSSTPRRTRRPTPPEGDPTSYSVQSVHGSEIYPKYPPHYTRSLPLPTPSPSPSLTRPFHPSLSLSAHSALCLLSPSLSFHFVSFFLVLRR